MPSTRPDSRLPHAWLEREGEQVSTLDLVPRDAFLLLTGGAGGRGADAAGQAERACGVRIVVVAAGDAAAVQDPRHAWHGICEIGDGGALLVRPDQIIAWRTMEPVADPSAQLHSVLRAVLRKNKAVS